MRIANRTLQCIAILALAGTLAASAQAGEVKVMAEKGKIGAAELVEVRAKVEAIDLATRRVTLKGDDGIPMTITAGDDVKNLDQVKVGDEVLTQLYQSLTIELAKADAALELSEKYSDERAEKGELPGGIKTHTIEAVAKITAIDAAASTVTLVGPRGNAVTLDVDAEVLKNLKVEDRVAVTYTEAVAIGVSRVTIK